MLSAQNSYNFGLKDTLSIEELMLKLSKLSATVAADNEIMRRENQPYPLSVRQMQMVSIKSLVDAIERTHIELQKHMHPSTNPSLSPKEQMFQNFMDDVDRSFDPSQN